MFRTKVIPSESERKISHGDKVLAIGSCFAQNVGNKLKEYKFDITINPFGTLFNPLSIFKLVNQAAHQEIIESLGVVENQGIFHHFDLHSDLSNLNKTELLENANHVLHDLGKLLPSTSWIIYTFGTAIVYELRETGEIVANCHKVSASKFNRRMLDVEEIVQSFKVNHDLLKSFNKQVKFILTVSPVRHQRESFEQNNVSKATLRLACERIISQYEDVVYFPAFEIMMDELRDYRFYTEDMLHPNAIATDYIWDNFQDAYFDGSHKDFVLKWEKVRKAMAHRPFNPETKEHQLFIKKTIQLLDEFKDKVDVSSEQKILKDQLI